MKLKTEDKTLQKKKIVQQKLKTNKEKTIFRKQAKNYPPATKTSCSSRDCLFVYLFVVVLIGNDTEKTKLFKFN